MRYREVAAKLARLGCIEEPAPSAGSHRKERSPWLQLGSVLPDRGSKDLKTGTLRAVVRQLGLDWHGSEQA